MDITDFVLMTLYFGSRYTLELKPFRWMFDFDITYRRNGYKTFKVFIFDFTYPEKREENIYK